MSKREITDIRPQLKLRLSKAKAELGYTQICMNDVEKNIRNINQLLVQEDWIFDAPLLQ